MGRISNFFKKIGTKTNTDTTTATSTATDTGHKSICCGESYWTSMIRKMNIYH